MTVLKIAASAVLGYLFGSLSFAVIISKYAEGRDVRGFGSGNAGAANMARVMGLKFGMLTFAGDLIKTAVAMLLGRLIGGELGFIVAGAGCVVGHCFPLMFGFRGGKAVTVGAAIAIMLDWRLFVILILIFGLMFFITKRISVGSMSAGAAMPIGMLILGGVTTMRLILGIFVAVTILIMHRSNIKRLIHGEEAKFVLKREDK